MGFVRLLSVASFGGSELNGWLTVLLKLLEPFSSSSYPLACFSLSPKRRALFLGSVDLMQGEGRFFSFFSNFGTICCTGQDSFEDANLKFNRKNCSQKQSEGVQDSSSPPLLPPTKITVLPLNPRIFHMFGSTTTG